MIPADEGQMGHYVLVLVAGGVVGKESEGERKMYEVRNSQSGGPFGGPFGIRFEKQENRQPFKRSAKIVAKWWCLVRLGAAGDRSIRPLS